MAKKEEKITIEDVSNSWQELSKKFSSYASALPYGALSGFVSVDPYVQNQRLKQLNSYPVFIDRETLEECIKNPGYSELPLRQISWSLSACSYPYYKMLRLYSDILTYRYYAYPKYIVPRESKISLDKDYNLISRWLDKFQPSRTFRRIALECAIEGKRAYILRDKVNIDNRTVDYALLQELPSNWWKPTFKSQDSYYGISFNFTYFWTPGTTPDQFPPIFQDYYKQLISCTEFSPAGNSIDITKVPPGMSAEFDGMLNKWYLWAELPPDLAWCFSLDESQAWQVPPFMGLFLTLQDLGSYQFLQTQLASIPLYGILSGEIPLHDDNKAGSTTDDLRLSPGLVTSIMAEAESKLPPGVSAVFSPLTNIKFSQFQQQVNSSKIYSDALQQAIATAGLTGLQSTSEKPSVAMVKASQVIESRFADVLYGQFKQFVDTVFEKHLNLLNGWGFEIFGNAFSEESEKQDLEKQLAGGQSYLLPKMLAYYGMDLMSANSISDWVDYIGIYNKLKVQPNSYTASDKKNGRPTISDSDVTNENTANSKDSGLNTADSRYVCVDEEGNELEVVNVD